MNSPQVSAAGLIVGGEQRLSTIDTHKFVIKNWKGFVKIALETGASFKSFTLVGKLVV